MNDQNIDQWQKQYAKNQEQKLRLDDLHKLYTIIYEKIKEILKNAHSSDPTKSSIITKIEEQIRQVKQILNLLCNDKDSFIKYLYSINFINQYKKQIKILLQILQTTLEVEKNKAAIQKSIKLRRFSALHLQRIKNSAVTLDQQIRRSYWRYKSVKAGQRLSQKLLPIQYFKLIKQQKKTQLQENQMIHDFQIKRRELQTIIRDHITKINDYEISFQKKYEHFQQYLKKKQDFTKCYVGHQYFKSLQSKQNAHPPQNQQVILDTNYQALKQFNIKIRQGKPKLKEKIESAIQQVKGKLIQEFHENKMNKFQMINPDFLIQLIRDPKKKKENLKTPLLPFQQNDLIKSSTHTSNEIRTNDTKIIKFIEKTPSTMQKTAKFELSSTIKKSMF